MLYYAIICYIYKYINTFAPSLFIIVVENIFLKLADVSIPLHHCRKMWHVGNLYGS